MSTVVSYFIRCRARVGIVAGGLGKYCPQFPNTFWKDSKVETQGNGFASPWLVGEADAKNIDEFDF